MILCKQARQTELWTLAGTWRAFWLYRHLHHGIIIFITVLLVQNTQILQRCFGLSKHGGVCPLNKYPHQFVQFPGSIVDSWKIAKLGLFLSSLAFPENTSFLYLVQQLGSLELFFIIGYFNLSLSTFWSGSREAKMLFIQLGFFNI